MNVRRKSFLFNFNKFLIIIIIITGIFTFVDNMGDMSYILLNRLC
jgi:hypothetical protein